MALAQWLVAPNHPLTARVVVNRIWQQYFGIDIVATAEDFGSQGEWPSHPRLLDWLAVEFVESGWDMKHMHRLIVGSATYRQSALAPQEAYQRDPRNRLLGRGPRFRMDAEMIRDSALFASGLLAERLGGKSVKPYQPEGLWKVVGYTSSNTANFKRDSGSALYRRSMYTFWKRTSPPPGLQILDAPSREVCTARRTRTNTPTAALVLMNDVQFVEAARNLATRMIAEHDDQRGSNSNSQTFNLSTSNSVAAAQPRSDLDCLRYGFRLATTRIPTDREVRVMMKMLREFRLEYRRDPSSASQLVAQGESKPMASVDTCELAAWTMVANALLNLDEAIVK